MDEKSCLNANTIGYLAHEILHTEQNSKVCGITSKGIFAVTENRSILFISNESYKGPFTINLNEKIPVLYQIPLNTDLLLSPHRISFSKSGLEIIIDPRLSVWNPVIQIRSDIDLQALKDRSVQIHKRLSSLDQNYKEHSLNDNQSRSAFSAVDQKAVLQHLVNMLGRGRGLTPSGDDFICGFLLAAHAWNEILYPGSHIENLSQNIVELAREKTTTLSANLISSATAGSTDERIINCVNWFNIGHCTAEFIIKELQSYGSSSGLDTLAGILTFIQSSPVLNRVI